MVIKEKTEILTISAACLIVIAMMGCQPQWVNKIGSDMDRLAKGYEKFGTVTMSSPILIEAKSEREPNGGGYFDFSLSVGPNDFYKDALTKVQGQSAIFDQFVKTSGFGLNVQADVTAFMGYTAGINGYAQKVSDYQAQRTYLSQAAELKAQKVMAEANAANAAQLKAAEANAAEIRAQALSQMPAYPAPPSCNLPAIGNIAPDANRVQGVLGDGNFTRYLGLLSLLEGNTVPSISNRSAITTAAGDTVTAGIFRLLGNPAEAMKFKDKVIMFGVSMVTVSPGWLTNKNYTAELAVSCDYLYWPVRRDLLIKLRENEQSKAECYKDAHLIDLIKDVLDETPIDINKIEIETNKKGEKSYKTKDDFVPQRFQRKLREGSAPLFAAVSPMTDVDALDLASSQRLQISKAIDIAAALSFAGAAKGQAEYFEKWAERREQDVRTRTAYAAITAFSNGGCFGFRIKPRLQALENPALFESKAGYVLGQQAFPIAVIVGIDRDDLQLVFDIKRKEEDPNDEPERDEHGKLRLVAYEPMILFRQTTNWLPNKSTYNLERLSETERLRLAHSFIQAYENLESDKQLNNGKDANKRIMEFIKNRIDLLKYNMLDSWNTQYIPISLMVMDPNIYLECRKTHPGL